MGDSTHGQNNGAVSDFTFDDAGGLPPARGGDIERRARRWIMAEKKADECAHPGCNCPAAKGSKYCGPHWESVPINHLAAACECGYAGCAAGKAVGAAG